MDELEARTRRELQDIIAVLRELTGLPSHWSGRLELVSGARFNGAKPFSCDIQLHASLAGQDLRWRTMIHEALHSFSVGYTSVDYQEARGWEEGVVEYLQRLLRPTVLARAGAAVPEDVFLPLEDTHLFNIYLSALEELRLLLTTSPAAFYLGLSRVPLKERSASLLGQSQRWTASEKARLVRTFSRVNAVLKRKVN